jgi:hypothetical protein
MRLNRPRILLEQNSFFFTLFINACGFVIDFFCVETFGLSEMGFSTLFVITDGLLSRGRPRFRPVLFPLTTGVSLVLVGVRC